MYIYLWKPAYIHAPKSTCCPQHRFHHVTRAHIPFCSAYAPLDQEIRAKFFASQRCGFSGTGQNLIVQEAGGLFYCYVYLTIHL